MSQKCNEDNAKAPKEVEEKRRNELMRTDKFEKGDM